MTEHQSTDRMALLRQMLFVRRFEERCVQLYQAQRIRGFLHLYVGEEAIATGVITTMRSDDRVVATYREHGHALVKGVSATAVMAEMFGRVDGCSGGRGGSMHLFDAATNLCGGNAIVAGGLPLAIGLGLGDAMAGRDTVTACFFGEGAMAEGEFHESMNLAALWKLPVVFCCENNLYAMGTALTRSEAATDLALRAGAYGMPSWSCDGMDVEAVVDSARRALLHARGGHGPVFIEFRTYRFRAHSMYDPERYRDKEEVERWKELDPLTVLGDRLREAGELDDAGWDEMVAEVDAEIEAAIDAAEGSPIEPVEELLRHVIAETDTARAGTTDGGGR